MKILKSIFGNPIWIILLVTIIAFAIPRQFILGKSIAICSLMGISLLVLIFNRQWLRLFLGFLGYCIFIVGSIFFSMFDSMAEPNYEIGDRKFFQAFENLISNAIKYSPDGGKVFIGVVVKKDKVVISVTDEGIGIPKEDQKNIFSKF